MQPLRRCTNRQTCARVFQRLCRDQGLRRLGPHRVFSTARHNKTDKPDDDIPQINIFEQEFVRDNRGGIKHVGGPKSLQKRIEQLEQELNDLKTGKSLDWLPEEDREELQQSIKEAQESGEIEDNTTVDDEELEELLHDARDPGKGLKALLAEEEEDDGYDEDYDESPEVELRLPNIQTKSLQKLNKALRKAASDESSADEARQLWLCYRSSKRDVPGLIQELPAAAWKTLWQSQYDGGLSDDVRATHLWILLDDLLVAGQPLTSPQKMVRIEGHVAAGRLKKALKWWERWRSELQTDEEVFESFLELGPRIKVLMGQVEQAEKLALEVCRKYRGRAACFIPVIDFLLKQGDEQSTGRAAGLYVKLRCLLGSNMTLGDFDQLAMLFLSHGNPQVALGIFKDLVVFSRRTAHNSEESTAAYRTSMRLYDDIQAQSTNNANQLNAMAMKTLTFLPRSYENKFFYASWLKRLIGLNALDAAQRVVELMYTRGVRPDPIHLNGLMSAWLRSGRTSDRDLALKLGHAMIQARISFVASRDAIAAGQPPPLSPRDAYADLPIYLGKALPPATTETFAILLLHYTRYNMASSIEALQQALHTAALEPNAFFINHMLYHHMRADDFASAFSLFLTASQNNTRLDLATFNALWDICRKRLNSPNPGPAHSFPNPRNLFGRMISWLSQLQPREYTAAQASFTQNLHTQIIRCFYLARDIRGMLVALYALRDNFGFYPDMTAARGVLAVVASIGQPLPKRSTRVFVPGIGRARIRGEKGAYLRRRRGVTMIEEDAAREKNSERVAALLEQLRAQRKEILTQRGVQVDDLPAKCLEEENLWALGAFLRATVREAVAATAMSERQANSADGGRGSEGSEGGEGSVSNERQQRESVVQEVDEDLEFVAFEMAAGGMQVGAPVYERGPDGEWRIQRFEEGRETEEDHQLKEREQVQLKETDQKGEIG